VQKFLINGIKLLEFLVVHEDDPKSLPGFSASVKAIASAPKRGNAHIFNLGRFIFHSLRARAESISLGATGTHEDLISRMLSGLSETKEFHFKNELERASVKNRLSASLSQTRGIAQKVVQRLAHGRRKSSIAGS
jgi:hypothetical protein